MLKPLCLLALPLFAAAVLSAQETSPHVQQLAELSTIPAEHIQALDEYWQDSPNRGMVVTSDALDAVVGEFQKLDPAQMVERLLKNYASDAATMEMAGAAMAVRAAAGYGAKRSTLNKKRFGAKKPQDKALIESVSAVMQQFATQQKPMARLAAIEFLLQVHSEGLINLHNMSGNGGRRPDEIPHDVTALAAPFLADKDPFVRALADWTISITICNENDFKKRGPHWEYDDKPKPDWAQAYLDVPVAAHLDFDHVRQAVTLGLHRRPADLISLADDVSHRATARATWVQDQGHRVDLAPMQQRLAALKKAASADPLSLHQTYLDWRRSVRLVVLQGPDINFDSMVYIKRFNVGAHLQPGVHSGGQFPNGGDIFVQSGLEPDAETRTLVADKLGGGFGHDLDLWYDADRIVFSWKEGKKKIQKLYEIDLDGQNLTPVTDGPFDDVDPAYLPDGEVVFGSTRGEVAIMCNGSSGLASIGGDGSSGAFGGLHTNIFRTWDSRSRVERLSYCKDDDAYPHVLNDGRVVYMRWDYQERGVNEIFSLWVMYPDGSGADGFHKVHIPAKITVQALRDTRAVPNSNLLISAGGGHYNYAEGALVLGDPSHGINNPDSLKNLTPYASPVLYGWGQLAPVEEGGVPYVGGYYCKPWPLSSKSFIASASYNQPQSNNFQLYYLDVWGNKELLQRDKIYEVVAAAAIAPREKPPVLPNRTDDSKTAATLYVENVYADLPGIEKGTVKHIRILQMIHWIKGIEGRGVQYHPLANAAECFAFGTGGAVRTVGTVPVNADGSAVFEVPSDADLYFQALDKDYRAVQRMRTHVEFQPGEVRGCVGCHETKSEVVASMSKYDKLGQPQRPVPPPWGDTTLIDYETMIQPILSKKCVECHAGKPDQGWLDLTDKRDQFGFMQGYRALYGLKASDQTPDVHWSVTGAVDRRKVKLPRSHKHPWWDAMFDYIIIRSDETGGRVTKPLQFGAIRHPFAIKLVEDPEHRKRLTDQEVQLLMNYFDVQAPYFDTYRQKQRKDLIQVRVEPYPPFGTSRQHAIHQGKDVTPKFQ
jgi:hypothetical protein